MFNRGAKTDLSASVYQFGHNLRKQRDIVQTFISFDDARSIELDTVASGRDRRAEAVRLDEALGRTLAERIESRDTIPPFDNSAMDGYAVRVDDLEDLPATLEVRGEVAAGSVPDRDVRPGTCLQIMTGAPIPDGADGIVPVEWTERDGSAVRIDRAPDRGQYIRPAGQDVADGETIFDVGTVVTPAVVGMLGTLGWAEVEVAVPPRVAVISTGDELVDVGEPLQPGQIRNANGPALAAQVRTAGAVPVGPFLARDRTEHIRSVVDTARADADVLVFSGGVSMGEYDLVRDVLDDMGFEAAFWKVRQRPGKPLTFGTIPSADSPDDGRLPVFGLPGNPVSSAMCFEQHVRPALATMMGRREVVRPRHPAVLEADTAKVETLHHFTRGIAHYGDDGRLHVRDTGNQQSNLYSSVVKANCILHLPEGLDAATAGLEVEIEWLDW